METRSKSKEGMEDEVHDILIVDDEEKVLNVLEETLESYDKITCNITTANDGEEAMKKVKKNDHDLILSDYMMPNKDGVTFLSEVKDESPDTVRILITGHGDLEIAKEAINRADINQFLEKPWDNEELRYTVYEALKRKKEREEDDITDIDDVDHALQEVKERQDEISQSPGGVVNKEELKFEFDSRQEFDKFSFELKNLKNVHIEDVHIYENKYIITVGMYPKSFEKIK